MGQIQKILKKMSNILYLVSIQLYYVWVLDFRELSKSLYICLHPGDFATFPVIPIFGF
jgi:hypothetical protein